MGMNGKNNMNGLAGGLLSNGELWAEVSADYFRRILRPHGDFIPANAGCQRRYDGLPAEAGKGLAALFQQRKLLF